MKLTLTQTPMKKINKNKNSKLNINSRNDVSKKLYKFGFKKVYITKMCKLLSNETWKEYDYELTYLSAAHIIDDLVDLIGNISPNIDHFLQNIRKTHRSVYKYITDDIRDHYSLMI